MKRNAFRSDDLSDFFDRKNHSGLVVRPHDRYQRGVVGQRGAKLVKVERSVFIHAQPRDAATFFLQVLAQTQHRRVFNLSGYDVAFIRARFEHAADRRVIAFRAATGENHFDGIGGAQQSGDLRPRLIDFLADLAAETMDARRIAIVLRQKRQHRFCDLGQHSGRRIVIDVNLARHNCSLTSDY